MLDAHEGHDRVGAEQPDARDAKLSFADLVTSARHPPRRETDDRDDSDQPRQRGDQSVRPLDMADQQRIDNTHADGSEESRGGKECGGTCSYMWTPKH